MSDGSVSRGAAVAVAIVFPKLLKVRAVAEIFDVSVPTVWRWTRAGLLPCTRIGHATRWKESTILDVLNRMTAEAAPGRLVVPPAPDEKASAAGAA